jgi:hypothetical protein
MLNLLEDAALISVYTRRDAIDDGVLVDVSGTAREAGIRYPVALTERVFKEIVTPDDVSKAQGQDEAGRLWDVLWMFRCEALKDRCSMVQVLFGLLVVMNGKQKAVRLKAVCGPGDADEPVITIMFPDED